MSLKYIQVIITGCRHGQCLVFLMSVSLYCLIKDVTKVYEYQRNSLTGDTP